MPIPLVRGEAHGRRRRPGPWYPVHFQRPEPASAVGTASTQTLGLTKTS